MPLQLGTKNCLECSKTIELKIKRDILRKKFCSHSCRAKYAIKNILPKDHIYKYMHLANTKEANLKKSLKGENHPFYKKDRSLIKSKRPRYENTIWKKQVFERDNYTCQFCGIRGGKLNADHIKPYSIYVELRWDISNGRTLCVSCHKKTETYGKNSNYLRKVG